MLWLTVRQFRFQALVAAAGLAALGVVVLVVGLQVLGDYHASVRGCTAGSSSCIGAANEFLDKYQSMGQWLTVVVLVVPGVLGIFWGAPLVAHELETGTFRLAWTQSVSRTRWTVCKLVLLGLAAMTVAGLCSLAVTWWASPLDRVAGLGPFADYASRDIVPIGYAAFAFTLGVAAGALLRRAVPAMGATLAIFVAVRVAFTEWVRPHLMAPLTVRTPFTITSPRRVQVGSHLPPGSWIVHESIVDRAGRAVPGLSGSFNLSNVTIGAHGVTIAGVGTCPGPAPSGAQPVTPHGVNPLVAQCVDRLHLSDVVTYQPASRYWPFQTYETLLFVLLALGVGAFALWRVRHID